MNDRRLSLLFRRYRERGDGRALAAVFDATAKQLLDLACHLVRDPAEAEDLVQATFLAAIRKSQSFDESAPVQAWLYGILWREAARARRRAARTLDPHRLTERSEPDPLEVAAGREVPAAVRAALSELPRHYREVLEPLLFDDQRADSIARELDRSPGTVRSQIHRGLEELRRALAPRLAAYGAFALPTRGLESVRAAVMKAGGFSPATAATAPAVALGVELGGVLVSKSVLIGAAAVLLALGGAWIAFERSSQGAHTSEASAGASQLASAPARSTPTVESATSEPGETRSAESVASAPAAPKKPSFDDTVKYWLGRFGEAPDDWSHGLNVAAEIAKLPPDEALAIMTAVWPQLSVPVREQAMKPFVFGGGHPRALAILDLAARDATLSVQQRAFTYLESYAFQDFSLDYEGYLRWAAVNKDRPLGEALTDSARRFVDDMLALTPVQRAERMYALRRLDLAAGKPAGVDLAAVIREAGGLRMLEATLGDADVEVQALALSWSKTIGADERWLRTWALPAIEQPENVSPEVVDASISALGRSDCGWARDSLLSYLERATRAEQHGSKSAGQALADIGDLSAIPRMIELILKDHTGQLGYDVGYYGLAKLTGVKWQKSYDGAWWASWWEKNRARFPAEVAALEIRR